MKLIEVSKTGKHAGKHFAKVDDEDFERLNKYKWYVCKRSRGTSGLQSGVLPEQIYAIRFFKKNGKRFLRLLHREVMGVENNPDIFIDHRDHVGLNCQKYNLRPCTASQNMMNRRKTVGSSKYKGVLWQAKFNRWLAKIKIDRKQVWSSRFKTEEEAAMAYDKKATELFGDFAWLNFP